MKPYKLPTIPGFQQRCVVQISVFLIHKFMFCNVSRIRSRNAYICYIFFISMLFVVSLASNNGLPMAEDTSHNDMTSSKRQQSSDLLSPQVDTSSITALDIRRTQPGDSNNSEAGRSHHPGAITPQVLGRIIYRYWLQYQYAERVHDSFNGFMTNNALVYTALTYLLAFT